MLRAEALKAVTHGVAAPNRILRTLQGTRLPRVIERKSVPCRENGSFHRPRMCGFAALFVLFLTSSLRVQEERSTQASRQAPIFAPCLPRKTDFLTM